MSHTPNQPRVFHAFVSDASARNHMFFSSSDGNFTQVQQEAQALAAAPGARVIAYEQNEQEKMRDPLTGRVPGEDDQDDEPSDEVQKLVVQLAGSMGKLTRALVTDGIPRRAAATVPPAAKPYRAAASDVRAAQIAGAGKAVDEMNTRVFDGTEPLKEAGFDVPLQYVWDPISCRYRIT